MSIERVLTGERSWHVEQSDVLTGLRALPDCCIHVAVTSPPYWALRSYLADDHADKHLELGSEPTPEEYIANMVGVFREVKRVLREDGVCWVNIGDTYNAAGRVGHGTRLGNKQQSNRGSVLNSDNGRPDVPGLKDGDLVGIPWMLAFALRSDGWYLRNDLCWNKLSPMPESISGWYWAKCRVKTRERMPAPQGGLASWDMGEHTHGPSGAYRGEEKTIPVWQDCPGCKKCLPNDGYVLRRGKWRHTRAHESIFMLAKSARYFCDGVAVAELALQPPGLPSQVCQHKQSALGRNGSGTLGTNYGSETRNPRSVIRLASEPLKDLHFAAYPTELVRPLLLASTSEKGYCPACGEPVARIIRKVRVPTRPADNNKRTGRGGLEVGNSDPERHVQRTETLGWRATCSCNAGEPQQGIVLDPFSGAGTSGVVARRLGLRYIGLELNPEYVEMSRKRIKKDLPLLNA